MADQDDKQWLYDNGHMPITGGKVSCVKLMSHQDQEKNLPTMRSLCPKNAASRLTS